MTTKMMTFFKCIIDDVWYRVRIDRFNLDEEFYTASFLHMYCRDNAENPYNDDGSDYDFEIQQLTEEEFFSSENNKLKVIVL